MLKKITLLSVSVMSLSACATIFSPSSDNITFHSNPSEAKVYMNGGYLGVTPLTTSLKRELSSPYVSIKKEGYETQTIPLQTEFNSTSLLNTLFWPGYIIDAATGNLMKYSVSNYEAELDKK